MEKETVLELIHFAPYILGTKNGYRVKKMLEQLVPLVYSNKLLPRSMSRENFQRNILNMYKKFYGKDWNMDYKSFCFVMRIPLNIAPTMDAMTERPRRLENMEKGSHYILYLKLGEYNFSIVGTLEGFLTDSGHTKYWELSEEEKEDVLIALSNRSLGTVMIPVRILQEYVAISTEEMYEAGMFILKKNPKLLYEHQNHYSPDSVLPVCEERISVVDYIDQLFDDVEDELIIDKEAVFELYKNRFSEEMVHCYIETCQKQFDIVKDVIYLNKYEVNRSGGKGYSSCCEAGMSSMNNTLEDNTEGVLAAAREDVRIDDMRTASHSSPCHKIYGKKRGKRRVISYHSRKPYSI